MSINTSFLRQIVYTGALLAGLGLAGGATAFAQQEILTPTDGALTPSTDVTGGQLAPCAAIAAGAPDHGSGSVPCNHGKVFYRAEQGVVVNVEITGTKACTATLTKNVDANNLNGKECGKTNDKASFTCFDVRNLELLCEGRGSEACTYRITQITVK